MVEITGKSLSQIPGFNHFDLGEFVVRAIQAAVFRAQALTCPHYLCHSVCYFNRLKLGSGNPGCVALLPSHLDQYLSLLQSGEDFTIQ